MDLHQFHKFVDKKPGLRRVQDRFAYQYNVERSRMNTDPFVRKLMKVTSHKIDYDGVEGFTKRPSLDAALATLAKYAYLEKGDPKFDKKQEIAFRRAIAATRDVFIPKEKLYRLSTVNAVDQIKHDSAAGFSFPQRKKYNVIEEMYDTAAYIQHFVEDGRYPYEPPCKLALRGHLHHKDDSKTRPVWVYPGEITVLEAKWSLPFQKHLEENVAAVHAGPGSMPKLAHLLNHNIGPEFNTAEVTCDWSSFDTSIPNWLIDTAFNIVFDSFDSERLTPDDYASPRLGVKNGRLYGWLQQYFKSTKIMLPDGTVYRKHHGIPSGSHFTQIIGSIVNFLLIKYIHFYYELDAYRTLVLGDDSSFLMSNVWMFPSFKELSHHMWIHFRMTLNPDKIRVAVEQPQRQFLGYQVSGYSFVRPDDDWFKLVLYPERDVQSIGASAARVFAYLLLGGHASTRYSNFFIEYFRRYPNLMGQQFRLTAGLRRMFKYVMGIELDVLTIPDLSKVDWYSVPYVLSLGHSLIQHGFSVKSQPVPDMLYI